MVSQQQSVYATDYLRVTPSRLLAACHMGRLYVLVELSHAFSSAIIPDTIHYRWRNAV
jgi:hypothetical protein